MKAVKIAVSILEWFVFGFIIFLFLVVISPFLSTRQYLASYVITSGSMEPVIPTGSLALVKTVNPADLVEGDIIAFQSPKRANDIILHRIFVIKSTDLGTKYLTKGDNNSGRDDWEISSASVKGIFYRSLPYLGYPIAYARSPLGFILLIGIPALLLVIFQIIKIKQGISEHIQRKTDEAVAKLQPVSAKLTIVLILGLAISLTGKLYAPRADALLSDTALITGVSLTAASGFAPPAPSFGDVVINEINWAGNNTDDQDEWIELKNITSSSIDLTNWVLENLGPTTGSKKDFKFISGTIPANSYFLISAKDQTASQINISPDVVFSSMNLNNNGELLILRDSHSTLIDSANASRPGGWYAGYNGNSSNPTRSMERKTPPGDGTQSVNWQSASTHTNMKGQNSNDEFGTPKADNGI